MAFPVVACTDPAYGGSAVKSSSGWNPTILMAPGAHVAGGQGDLLHRRCSTPCSGPTGWTCAAVTPGTVLSGTSRVHHHQRRLRERRPPTAAPTWRHPRPPPGRRPPSAPGAPPRWPSTRRTTRTLPQPGAPASRGRGDLRHLRHHRDRRRRVPRVPVLRHPVLAVPVGRLHDDQADGRDSPTTSPPTSPPSPTRPAWRATSPPPAGRRR